ncbi:acyl-CoA carboxylase subunit epsilon [Streptomyces sp. ML-6]|uniref:acyl-CoA carboxylase subunit epsilon n=1 Tax=Streptomyces sp. ML-6 TaxID=2982693 RepID=UPI0024C0C702|nr:acyl-CoA carboxylase subunit epsilon [Streptomyces sp. ML-6]MDK0524000.1 acyl-CoA carboxylase subunit epsilon [Streptomyces sp. ML-6]
MSGSGGSVGPGGVWCVERGRVTDEELAALAVVLCALGAGRVESVEGTGRVGVGRAGAGCAGSRWWRYAGRYRAPLGWQ